MFSIVPVLDELISHPHPHHPSPRVSPFGQISLMDDFRNQLGFSNEIKTIEDSDKQLTLACNVQGFSPDHIKVKMENGFIKIEGDYEHKEEHSFVKRQFKRQFSIPKNAVQEKMNCSLSQNGVLKITIPKQPKAIQSDSVNIPIQFSK